MNKYNLSEEVHKRGGIQGGHGPGHFPANHDEKNPGIGTGRSLDEIYWDSMCDKECKCKDLQQALIRHPALEYIRAGTEPVFTLKVLDESAPALVQQWIVLNHDAPAEKLHSAHRVLEAFRTWPVKKKKAD
jgi:hypothetical protein